MSDVYKFIEANIPATKKMGCGEMEGILTLLGLKVAPDEEYPGMLRVIGCKPEDGWFNTNKLVDLTVNYSKYDLSIKGDKLTFFASVGFCRVSSGPLSCIVNEEIQRRYDVLVDLPEKVVDLPVPEWVSADSSDGYSSVFAIWMYESEARAAADKFRADLDKVLPQS